MVAFIFLYLKKNDLNTCRCIFYYCQLILIRNDVNRLLEIHTVQRYSLSSIIRVFLYSSVLIFLGINFRHQAENFVTFCRRMFLPIKFSHSFICQ